MISAVLLLVLGAIFVRVLVFDDDDNAYLWLLLTGYLLIATSVPFALASLLPYTLFRRIVVIVALAFLWIVGAFGVFLLVVAMLITLSQGDADVFVAHLLALLALLPALFLAGFRFAR